MKPPPGARPGSPEEDLRRLFEAAPVPLILTRRSDSTVLMLNRVAARTFEVDAEAVVGRAAVDFYVHPADRARFLEAMSRDGSVDRMELELKTARGRHLWASVSASVIDFRGEPVVMVGLTDLTERDFALRALRESEERFRALAEESPVGVYQQDLQGNCIYTNARWTEITGLRPEEARGVGWLRAVHPDDIAKAGEAWTAAVSGGRRFTHELRFVRPDGSVRWVSSHAGQVHDADGRVMGYVGTIEDITERRRSDEVRKESEQMLRLVLDTIPVRVFWKDRDLRYLGSNRMVAEDAGLASPEEIVGRTDDDFAWSEQAQRYQADDRTVMESGRPKLNYEEPLSTHGGGVIWARTSKFPLRDAAGRVVGILGTFEDITERKEVEEGRRLLAERLALATQAAAIGVWELDLATQTLHIDDQFVALYGGVGDAWEPAELWTERLHPEDQAASAKRRRAALAQETAIYDDEVRVIWPDGSLHHVKNLGRLVRDSFERPLRLVGVSMDITPAKRAEADIRQLNTELERRVTERTSQLTEANRELESFSYSVSHDLRAPLRAIDGFSQALVEDFGDRMDDNARGHLRRVRLASQRMGQLIDDLLNLSRTSRAELFRRPVSLSVLAEAVVTQLRVAHPERKVEALVAPDLVADADESLARVLLENLVGNAWKYTSKRPQARIEVGRGPETGVFFVKDDGDGFDPAFAHKLFGPFQRLHGIDEFEGTGIGLATVHRIVMRHGGRVWGESQPGKGATFYFSLGPAVPAADRRV